MKVSIFPGVEPKEMSYATQVVDVELAGLGEIICNFAWSPSVFKSEPYVDKAGVPRKAYHRSNSNLHSMECVAVDVDSGMTLIEAEDVLVSNNLAGIIATTKSHCKEKTTTSGKIQPACDRFRVVIKLASPIYSDAELKQVFQKLQDLFPSADPSCKDAARFYFKCSQVVKITSGDDLTVDLRKLSSSSRKNNEIPSSRQKKGRLSNATKNFISHGAADGEWHGHFFKASMDMKEQGYSFEEAKTLLEMGATNPDKNLDVTDLKQLRDIYENRDVRYPPRNNEANESERIAKKVESNLQQFVQMSDVVEKDVEFIWSPYIPKKFVSLFTGDPGTGKSTVMAHITSIISCGGHFWDGQKSEEGSVVIFTAEDPLEEVLKPRLEKAGVKSDRVYAFTLPLEFDEVGRKTIVEAIKKYKPSLLVIDPIVAYIGSSVDTSRANEVRARMQFLADAAKEYELAILVVRHCAKGTGDENLLYRGHGSIDFVAFVRSEVMMVTDTKNPAGRFFGQSKSNLSKLGDTLYFEMTDRGPQLGRIEQKTLAQLLDEDKDISVYASEVEDTESSVLEILKFGPTFKKTFFDELLDAGSTKATIRRALKRLKTSHGVSSERVSFISQPKGRGVWLMCTREQAQALEGLKFEHLDQLIAKLDTWMDQDVQKAGVLSHQTTFDELDEKIMDDEIEVVE